MPGSNPMSLLPTPGAGPYLQLPRAIRSAPADVNCEVPDSYDSHLGASQSPREAVQHE